MKHEAPTRLKLDRHDSAILRLLQANARLSNKAVAGRVGLSASACLERIVRLEETGVISGYGAKIDNARLGLGFEAFFFLNCADWTRARAEDAVALLRRFENVIAAYELAGSFDVLLHVATADLAASVALQRTMEAVLAPLSAARVNIVLRPLKRASSLPVPDHATD